MHLRSRSIPLRLTAATLLALPAAVTHADVLGLYLGAGVGSSDVKVDSTPEGLYRGFDRHDTGWKALIGLRPIPFLGVEGEYVDFGSPHNSQPIPVGTTQVHAHGAALFGVAYLPLPVPFLDVYAKAGLARLQQSGSGQTLVIDCLPPFSQCGLFRFDQTDTRFAWGAGTQFKFSSLAVRAEFEQFSSSIGNPNFLSVAVTYSF